MRVAAIISLMLLSLDVAAQYERLIIGKWIIDSVRTEELVAGNAMPGLDTSLNNEIVRFHSDGIYSTAADSVLKARYEIGNEELPLLVIYSLDKAHPLYMEAEIIELSERRMVLAFYLQYFDMYIYYRRLE